MPAPARSLVALALVVLATGCERHAALDPVRAGPAGMVWIPGGEFSMGSEAADALPQERPVHRVRVSGFWLDRTEVTNAEFGRFVDATGHVTVAERAPDAAALLAQLPPGTPPPHAEDLVPGSLAFAPKTTPTWRWEPGACWRHPEGLGSDLRSRSLHPVVHVAYEDALAYAAWAGKRLPTEAEWEWAARAGREQAAYPWGDDPPESGPWANYWQGPFPAEDRGLDGFVGTAPVASFPPNAYGLYDVAGNVWEWCADWYRADHYAFELRRGLVIDPRGPGESFDPIEPTIPKRVLRGGSFLCAPEVCAGYRCSSRMRASPDTGACHTGFRCAR